MGTDVSSPIRPSLFDEASQWFRRARASLLEAIPCGRGCCDCCVGIFPITRLDAKELRHGLDTMPTSQRNTIVTRAAHQVDLIEARYPDLHSAPCLDTYADATIDEMVEQFSHLPCPALGSDGTCQVYAFRPVTCRTMGIPSESNGVVDGACTVQTAIPIIRLSPRLQEESRRLAEHEAAALSAFDRHSFQTGDELLLPYGFL
ncbi:MAG: YkgJ family cysteine cluster protein [Nitrospira sp.]|nr:YkgJ family cysteine cluster protein [Nitrospira sp.]